MSTSRGFSKTAALAAAALFFAVSFAREAGAQGAPAPAAAPAPTAHAAASAPTAPAADVAPEKGLKGRIFTVAHRDPETLVRILRPLGSGAHGAVIYAESGSGTISARDFPENLATMEDALKRLDVVEPVRADVELKIHVLLASNRPDESTFPEELKEVIAALRGTLLYKSYSLATTFVERVKDRARVSAAGVVRLGLPLAPGKEAPALQIDCYGDLKIGPGAAGAPAVHLDGFSLSADGRNGFSGHATVRTDLTLRPGEKVVVGTSSLGDRGLVVVVSANLVK